MRILPTILAVFLAPNTFAAPTKADIAPALKSMAQYHLLGQIVVVIKQSLYNEESAYLLKELKSKDANFFLRRFEVKQTGRNAITVTGLNHRIQFLDSGTAVFNGRTFRLNREWPLDRNAQEFGKMLSERHANVSLFSQAMADDVLDTQESGLRLAMIMEYTTKYYDQNHRLVTAANAAKDPGLGGLLANTVESKIINVDCGYAPLGPTSGNATMITVSLQNGKKVMMMQQMLGNKQYLDTRVDEQDLKDTSYDLIDFQNLSKLFCGKPKSTRDKLISAVNNMTTAADPVDGDAIDVTPSAQ